MRDMIKHISFDFWNTIAKPNPAFARERADFLAYFFAVSPSVAKKKYAGVKAMLDKAAETHGEGNSRQECIRILFEEFGTRKPANFQINALANGLDFLFRKHPPTIDSELINAFWRADHKGITLSIASNTNFISGAEINISLIRFPFLFSVFSDQLGVSKPHDLFFYEVKKKAKRLRGLEAHEMVHVGDHILCDGLAIDSGLRFKHVVNLNTATIVNELLETV